MTVFDIVFVAMFCATLGSAGWAGLLLIRGRRKRAVRILVRLGIGVVVYLGIVISVSLATPIRVLRVGDEQCWDDWCLAVTAVRQKAAKEGKDLEITLRIFSRAHRRAQRALDAAVYLLDGQGRRYDPEPDANAVPLAVLLQPGESVTMTRLFHLPADATDPALVATHGTGIPGLLIIGDPSSLFHRRPIVRLDGVEER